MKSSWIATLSKRTRIGMALAVTTLGISLLGLLYVSGVHAQTNNPTPAARISFTFDDGLASASTQAAPTLAKYGLTATEYVPTSCIGSTGTCPENTAATYMTWAQVQALQNTSGWEIGSHTINTPCLADNTQPDCPNTALLTPAQVMQELTGSKQVLASHGITADSFASPFGDYNNAVLAQIAKVYTSHRGFADQNNNNWPYNDYLLNDFQVQAGVTVAQVEAKIDTAIANNTWLVLTFHDIKTNPSTNPTDYEYSTTSLNTIAAYVKAKQTAGLVQSVKVSKGLVTSDVNLLPNSSFNSGIASGWTTDSPITITKDTANNGSFPDPTNSVKLTSSTTNTHLFSPQVSVDPNQKYVLKSFLNVKQITGGEVAFYVDEYDANGNWVSGQYKTAERSAYVESLNFEYKPSSQIVKKASLQVIITANSGITAYIDNIQWFPENSVATPPPTNLMPNSTFDNGIADGWTTDDPNNIVKDANNNGSAPSPLNSIKLSGTTKNIHLFSPKIAVISGKKYEIDSNLNLKQITSGVVAYYIDEYDVNGNWVSGQYKLDRSSPVNGSINVQYQPTSTKVTSASLQIIVTANSGVTAYLDNVVMYALN